MTTPRSNPTSLWIIHIEDDPCDAELIEAALNVHAACQITTVTSRMALEAALEQGVPDFVISDSSLPGFDGLSALALVSQKHPHVPFVFCTGDVSEEKRAAALAHGAKDCIPKNDLTGLIALIKSLQSATFGKPPNDPRQS